MSHVFDTQKLSEIIEYEDLSGLVSPEFDVARRSKVKGEPAWDIVLTHQDDKMRTVNNVRIWLSDVHGKHKNGVREVVREKVRRANANLLLQIHGQQLVA